MEIEEAITLLKKQPVWDAKKSYHDNENCFSLEERDLIIELLDYLWHERQMLQDECCRLNLKVNETLRELYNTEIEYE